jgi:hypothetical protein
MSSSGGNSRGIGGDIREPAEHFPITRDELPHFDVISRS